MRRYIPLALALCMLLMFSLLIETTNAPAAAQENTPTPEALDYKSLPQAFSDEGFPLLGSPSAKIMLVEFTNFSCPGCAQYYPTVKQFIDQFVRSGQARLKLVPMVFDLGTDPSFTAAQAALCAGKQNGFWEMHDALFEIHRASGPESFTLERIKATAASLKLDGEAIVTCVLAGEKASVINNAIKLARRLELPFTPSLLYSLDGGAVLNWFKQADGSNYPSGVPIEVVGRIVAEAQAGNLQATATALGPATATPTPSDPFASVEYVTWKSPDNIFEVEHPKSWQPASSISNPIAWEITPPDNVGLGVGLIAIPISAIGVPDLPRDANAEMLMKQVFGAREGVEIRTVQTGGLNGFAVKQSGPEQNPNTGQTFNIDRDLWVLELDPKTVIIIQAVAPTELWPKMQLVFDRMTSTLKVNRAAALGELERIFNPTPTITPTPDLTREAAGQATAAAFSYVIFRSSDRLVEFEHPSTWTVTREEQGGPLAYKVVVPNSPDSSITFNVLPNDALGIDVPSGARAIDLLRQIFRAEPNITVREVQAGQFKGGGVTQKQPQQDRATGQYYDLEGELWALDLDDRHVIVLQGFAAPAQRNQMRAAFERFTKTLKINVAGAVAAISIALTPTLTPSPSPSPAVTPTPVTLDGGLQFSPVALGQGDCVGVKDPEGVSVPADGSTRRYSAPEQVIDRTHKYCAILTTDKGRIVIELYPQIAPQHVNSFVFLAQQGYFDNTTWHRVLPGFVAQGGDPTGTGTGGPGYTIPLEVSPLVKYDRVGVLGMARTTNPNSAGSQFFITYDVLPSLDAGANGPGYTIFGQVVEGMDVVEQIKPRDPQAGDTEPGDKLLSVRIVDLTASR